MVLPFSNLPKNLLPTSSTRWMSISVSVKRILEQWEELKLHFKIAANNEKCYTARQLFEMYANPINKCYMEFIMPILKEVQRVNSFFEAEMADPTKLLDELLGLIKYVGNRVITPGQIKKFDWINGTIDNYIDTSAYLGFGFENEVKLAEINQEDTIFLRKTCISLLVYLFKELQRRLPPNRNLLTKISLLSVSNALAYNKQRRAFN